MPNLLTLAGQGDQYYDPNTPIYGPQESLGDGAGTLVPIGQDKDQYAQDTAWDRYSASQDRLRQLQQARQAAGGTLNYGLQQRINNLQSRGANGNFLGSLQNQLGWRQGQAGAVDPMQYGHPAGPHQFAPDVQVPNGGWGNQPGYNMPFSRPQGMQGQGQSNTQSFNSATPAPQFGTGNQGSGGGLNQMFPQNKPNTGLYGLPYYRNNGGV